MMKRIIKKGILCMMLMLGMAFTTPQHALAGNNPFGDRGWICAGTRDPLIVSSYSLKFSVS